MSLCDKCIQGARHEGTPEGKIETIDGVTVYVATPAGDYAKDKAILYFPDIFGIELPNAKLLADGFAENGFKVYAIDYFNSDPVSADAMSVKPPTFDLYAWLSKHGADVTRPLLNKVIAELRKQGVTQFGATGYCYGARYVFDVAIDKEIKVAVVSHPSLLKVPEDLEKIKEAQVPLLINSCEVDAQFPAESQAKADEILGDGTQSSALYERKYFAGCEHGFAVRGDLSKPEVKAGKEGSFKAAVEFFRKHL